MKKAISSIGVKKTRKKVKVISKKSAITKIKILSTRTRAYMGRQVMDTTVKTAIQKVLGYIVDIF